MFRYLEQFKEIFTEEGRRAVKITTQKPGQPPHVEFTQTSQTPTTPGPTGPQGILSAHAPALTAAIKGQFTQVLLFGYRLILIISTYLVDTAYNFFTECLVVEH